MRFTHINCPGCGKAIDIDWDWTYFLCQYCRAKCVILSHNHPETPQETLERLHGEAWQTMEEQNYALAFGQYREILQHRINDGEAWHGRALAIGMRALDKENLRADEVIASFDEGLRRDPTPRSQIIYARHVAKLSQALHQFHYLHFRREPLHALRWNYYRNASDFALRILRHSQHILQNLLELPDQTLLLLLQATDGYQQCSLHEQASQTLRETARIIADIDRALLTGSLRLHGKYWIRTRWFGLDNHLPLNILPCWKSTPAKSAAQLQQEYTQASRLALGTASKSPKSEFDRYWTPYLGYGFACLLVTTPIAFFFAGLAIWLLCFLLIGFFGFFKPIRNRLWEKHCYASDVRTGVYDYQ